jgi:hypothetical protein
MSHMAASPANEVSTLSLRSGRSVRSDAESEAATAAVKSRGECGWRLAVGGWRSAVGGGVAGRVLLFEEELGKPQNGRQATQP